MKSNYLDRAMKARDPRCRKIAERLGYGRRDMQAETPAQKSDPLSEAREEYQAVIGKRPYHGWDVETLRAKIAEAKGE
ncbi:hypothetical protein [Nitratireductor basaltis]|uniref:Uncharacterized protein n=1 Tax=Nitratireductor basaltis TaxID=472175 RepID=A0A084UBK7_9HYPH|nr:hypothetical protein [Nitratireductor basaltis]KFB10343.1 hypothetical protein EL18_01374 [Nitratireductor basaltis]